MADFEEFYRRTVQRLQQDGFAVTVRIEPKEVVLKEFQQAEVERLLQQIETLTVWQKQVLKFVEAKGNQTEKSELLKRLLGKTANQVADYKKKYQEADQLADLGFLKSDPKGRMYPNLESCIQSQLEAYRPSAGEISDVVGQVLLRLK